MIGVCIKYFHENYGGMLQAFATTKVFEKLNINYELIRFDKKKTLAQKIRWVPRVFNGVLLNDKYEALKKKIGLKKHPEFAANEKIRMAAFDKFRNEKFVKVSPVYSGYRGLCQGANNYEAVVTGSDQLWSPAGLPTNFYNLMFVPDNIKKISYASSFGVKKIPWYQTGRTSKFLKRLDYISMRENSGVQIVEELTGRKVMTILDPVFMLDKEEWERAIPNEGYIEEKYIFAYFLGNNPGYRTAVTEFAKTKGCKIVTLRHLDQYVEQDEQFGDYAPYDVAPDKFLNLLRNAEYVFTDSFHGMCFSVIHKKKFVIFNRYAQGAKASKNTRIESLCENLSLSSRRYKGEDLSQADEDIDYEKVYGLLNGYKENAWAYLKEALGK